MLKTKQLTVSCENRPGILVHGSICLTMADSFSRCGTKTRFDQGEALSIPR